MKCVGFHTALMLIAGAVCVASCGAPDRAPVEYGRIQTQLSDRGTEWGRIYGGVYFWTEDEADKTAVFAFNLNGQFLGPPREALTVAQDIDMPLSQFEAAFERPAGEDCHEPYANTSQALSRDLLLQGSPVCRFRAVDGADAAAIIGAIRPAEPPIEDFEDGDWKDWRKTCRAEAKEWRKLSQLANSDYAVCILYVKDDRANGEIETATFAFDAKSSKLPMIQERLDRLLRRQP